MSEQRIRRPDPARQLRRVPEKRQGQVGPEQALRSRPAKPPREWASPGWALPTTHGSTPASTEPSGSVQPSTSHTAPLPRAPTACSIAVDDETRTVRPEICQVPVQFAPLGAFCTVPLKLARLSPCGVGSSVTGGLPASEVVTSTGPGVTVMSAAVTQPAYTSLMLRAARLVVAWAC